MDATCSDRREKMQPMASQALFRRNPSKFLRQYVTADETWILLYTPEAKEQSKQCTALD